MFFNFQVDKVGNGFSGLFVLFQSLHPLRRLLSIPRKDYLQKTFHHFVMVKFLDEKQAKEEQQASLNFDFINNNIWSRVFITFPSRLNSKKPF